MTKKENAAVAPDVTAYSGNDLYNIFETHLGFLLGDVLTVIDATFPDPVQRKAMKDLMRSKFGDRRRHVCELFTGTILRNPTEAAYPGDAPR
jgi:hypothetical protein